MLKAWEHFRFAPLVSLQWDTCGLLKLTFQRFAPCQLPCCHWTNRLMFFINGSFKEAAAYLQLSGELIHSCMWRLSWKIQGNSHRLISVTAWERWLQQRGGYIMSDCGIPSSSASSTQKSEERRGGLMSVIAIMSVKRLDWPPAPLLLNNPIITRSMLTGIPLLQLSRIRLASIMQPAWEHSGDKLRLESQTATHLCRKLPSEAATPAAVTGSIPLVPLRSL